MLELKVIAGTSAHPTCRWRCPACELSVVLSLTAREWALMSKMPVRIVNVSRPADDTREAEAWGEMTEDEALEIMQELHSLPTCDPPAVRSAEDDPADRDLTKGA